MKSWRRAMAENKYDFVRINDRRSDIMRKGIGSGWNWMATCKTVEAAKTIADALNLAESEKQRERRQADLDAKLKPAHSRYKK